MPYMYELKLDANEPVYTFLQQLVPAGSLVGTGQAVAMLTDGTMEFRLPAPRQGLLVEWHVESGAAIDSDDVVARIVCEGAESAVGGAIPERVG